MTLLRYLLHSAFLSETLISTAAHQKFDFEPNTWPWPQPLTLTLTFDLDLKARQQWWQNTILAFGIWPWPLTYDPNLAKVKVDPHGKNQGRRSNSLAGRLSADRRTDRHTDGCYQVHYLPASLSYAVDRYCKVICVHPTFKGSGFRDLFVWRD